MYLIGSPTKLEQSQDQARAERRGVRTGSWTGPPRGEKVPRAGISSTVSGVRVGGARLTGPAEEDLRALEEHVIRGDPRGELRLVCLLGVHKRAVRPETPLRKKGAFFQ